MKQRRAVIVFFVALIAFTSGGWFFDGAQRASSDEREKAQLFQNVLHLVADYYVDSIEVGQLYDYAIEGCWRSSTIPTPVFCGVKPLIT